MSKSSIKTMHIPAEKKANTPPGTQAPGMDKVSTEQRQQMIEKAAYYLAKRRGFQGGDPLQDWLEAESEIDHRLMGMRPN